MQIRKFEAKSMKDALQLVKQSLGPDAVILSAKDNRRAFGLAGDKSVEVTAAVAEETYRRMKIAQQKLRPEDLDRFVAAPAKKQREFINKVFEPQDEVKVPREMTATRYIDIGEDKAAGIAIEPAAPPPAKESTAESHRVRDAAKLAWEAVRTNRDLFEQEEPAKASKTHTRGVGSKSDKEIVDLKSEIKYLRSLLEGFQKVPQSFVPLHPGAHAGVPFDLSFMFEKLQAAGISVDHAVEMLDLCRAQLSSEKLKNKSYVDAWIAKYIMDQTRIAERSKTQKYQIFVGSTGQGKTSTLVKMASRMVISERKKVAIVTTDHQKIGAADQLRIFAQILNVPFAVLKQKEDWITLAPRLSQVDSVLVDMPGLSLRNLDELEVYNALLPQENRTVHFVQSVLAKDKDAGEILKRYRRFGLSDMIFTQLDESVQHGIIYNLQREMQLPLHSFGIGPQIPEDFEYATRERVVDLIFKLTKLRTGENAP